MKIVSAAEMREIDRITSEKFGVPSLTLMENAGTAVAQFVSPANPLKRRIGVICGKGNNGGDGFVAARHLHEAGRKVSMVLLTDPSELKGDAAKMFRRLPIEAIVVRTVAELQEEVVQQAFASDILLDAILGTGFRPPMSELYSAAIAAINASKATVIAVDVPSGADADAILPVKSYSIARADGVVTFTAPKLAHIFGGLTEGVTMVAPIGSPKEAIASSLNLNLIGPQDFMSLVAYRKPESNKGTYGHVLLLGGSFGKAGSVAMAAIAALRVGAGLSTVATAKSALSTVAGFHPEVMTEALDETDSGTISIHASEPRQWDELTKGKTVIAIGPGMSRHPETAELVRAVVRQATLPLVIDADALNAFEGKTEELNGRGRSLVITPHPGEMARLVGCSVADVQKDRIGMARSFAREHELIVVLKGHRTLVAHPGGTIWVSATGNPGMATGGTGDILTGMTAGFIAQTQKDVMTAVIAAVYMHGFAGDIARCSTGEHSLIATDLLTALPSAFRRARKAAKDPFTRVGTPTEPSFLAGNAKMAQAE